MKPGLRVIDPGLHSSLQDGGRRGFMRYGVPQSGFLDSVNASIANAIVGNELSLPALEILRTGFSFEVEAGLIHFAASGIGRDLLVRARHGVRTIPPQTGAFAARGDTVVIPPSAANGVFYIAVEGGFDATPALGSVSTYARAGIGGFSGRLLARGDILPLLLDRSLATKVSQLNWALPPPGILRAMRGPDAGLFPQMAYDTLFGSSFTIGAASDRMGLRLKGPALQIPCTADRPPQGTAPGTLQVPPDGQAVLLLADRQTTGGYPTIATVIGADIPAAGRLAPGMTIRFQETCRDQAVLALGDLADLVASLPSRAKPAPQVAPLEDRLRAENLIDGVTAGEDEAAFPVYRA